MSKLPHYEVTATYQATSGGESELWELRVVGGVESDHSIFISCCLHANARELVEELTGLTRGQYSLTLTIISREEEVSDAR